jgi:hypothetical protein
MLCIYQYYKPARAAMALLRHCNTAVACTLKSSFGAVYG